MMERDCPYQAITKGKLTLTERIDVQPSSSEIVARAGFGVS